MIKMLKTDRLTSRHMIGMALAAACVLLLPLLAMQVTDEVVWDLADFAVAWTLLAGAGLAYKLVAGTMAHTAYRAAVGLAVGTGLLLVWANLAVGLVGSEDNPVNLLYGGVLAVGFAAALRARLRPHGMARALGATALAQIAVAAIALIVRGGPAAGGLPEILLVNGVFAALWCGSAWLFWRAAQEQSTAAA